MNKNQNNLIVSEFKEVKNYIKADVRMTKIILVVFAVVTIFLVFLLKISIPLCVPVILAIWFLVYFLYGRYLDKKRSIADFYNLHFKFSFLDILFVTVIIHFIGGVEWIGGIFYLMVLSLSSVVLPKEKSRTLVLLAAILFSTMVTLEFYKIIPHQIIFAFQADAGLYQNPSYIISTTLVLFLFLLFSSDMISSFSEILRKKRSELSEARKKTEKALSESKEAKDVLEVRVRARTGELERLTKSLETQVGERTRELEKKVSELEKINKLMVGRELKMVELKKEIKGIKKSYPA